MAQMSFRTVAPTQAPRLLEARPPPLELRINRCRARAHERAQDFAIERGASLPEVRETTVRQVVRAERGLNAQITQQSRRAGTLPFV